METLQCLTGAFSNATEPAAPGSVTLHPFIFHPCGKAAAYMSFGLVLFKNLLHLQVKRPVDGFETFRKVFMYRAFAYAEFLCADRTVAFVSMMYIAKSQARPMLSQNITPGNSHARLYAEKAVDMRIGRPK